MGLAGDAAAGDPERAAGDEGEWGEEQEALQAIYDGSIRFPSQRRTVLALEGGVTLDVRLAPGSAYPDQPPVIGIRRAAPPSPAYPAGYRTCPSLSQNVALLPVLAYHMHARPAQLERPMQCTRNGPAKVPCS